MKLRYLLTCIFLVVSLGPVVLFWAWPHSAVLDGEFEEVEERHLLLARNLSAALERYHRDLTMTFELVLEDIEGWKASDRKASLLQNLSFRHFCLVNPRTGRVEAELSPRDTPCPETVPSDLLATLMGIATLDGVTFGSVTAGGTAGGNVIHMVKLVEGRLAIGAIKTTYFIKLGKAVAFGVKGHAAIVDHTGKALSHPLDDWVAERRDLSGISAVQRMMNGETGIEIFYSPALKGDMIAGLTSVEPVGWGVMIPQPVEELHQKADAAHRSFLIVLLLGATASFLLAMLVSVLAARPIEAMSRQTRQIADGNLAPTGSMRTSWLHPKELRDLKANFRLMVARLQASMGTINRLAFIDNVTGLANRELFGRRLSQILARNAPEDRGAILFLDLDGFKAVNDTLGHDVGDEILKQVGARIRRFLKYDGADLNDLTTTDPSMLPASLPPSPIISRLGGDEFAVYVPAETHDVAKTLAEGLLARLSKPYNVGKEVLRVGASVGLAYFPDDATDYPSVLKAADMAMYAAKEAGKSRVVRFEVNMGTAAARRRHLRDAIIAAIDKGEFKPHFQPQFDARDLSFVGVEALVRWSRPGFGTLSPSEFIEIAREDNLLQQIDQIMLERSLDMVAAANARGLSIPKLSVNLTPERLEDPALISFVRDRQPLPCKLHFEFLELSFLDRLHDRTAWTLEQLDALGVGFELDDFGSGHASVIALLNLQPKVLKIDRHLIEDVAQSEERRLLVSSIVAMGRAMGIDVTAEGVETQDQIRVLADLGCTAVQGYALAAPMQEKDFIAHIAAIHGVGARRQNRQGR